ncbi:MAG: DUF2188 domain-containing protein [Planctomycetes bacterium]|nr:DUF2188 domain-containing protein [Planctomycetota bacterium]
MIAIPLHVMPAGGRWEVTREGEFDIVADFADRGEALEWIRNQPELADTKLVIHAEDFSIESVQ